METKTSPAPRSRGRDINLNATAATIERARTEYADACRQHRFGGTPALRAAGLARAQQLRDLAHTDWTPGI